MRCNRTSCAQVYELPWGHWQIANNRDGTLSVILTLSLSLSLYIYMSTKEYIIIRKLGNIGRVDSYMSRRPVVGTHEPIKCETGWSCFVVVIHANGCNSTCTSSSLSLQGWPQISQSIEGEARWESYPPPPLSLLGFLQFFWNGFVQGYLDC